MALSSSAPPFVTPSSKSDNYMDLNGLQSIRQEKDQSEALKKVAQQFESMFINLMLKSMRSANSVFEEDSIFKSNESDFYRDMHDNQLALTMANGRGLGIAEVLYRQMNRNYGGSDTPQPPLETLGNVQQTQKLETAQPIRERVAIAENEKDFVNKVLPYAMVTAKKMGVDPLALIAQSALETGWGKSVLADEKGRSSNNLFNIKTGNSWQGDQLTKNSLEFKNGVFVKENSNFRQYSDIGKSFNDYADFISNSDRYKHIPRNAVNAEKYIEQLQSAGYATDPRYSEKVISVLHRVSDMVSNSELKSALGTSFRSNSHHLAGS